MGAPAAGAVVLVPFPFSDLSHAKRRPAVVLADVGRGDRLLCQITSNPYGDAVAVPLDTAAFARGSLEVQSYARPGKLFTASGDLIVAEVGALTPDALKRIVDAIVACYALAARRSRRRYGAHRAVLPSHAPRRGCRRQRAHAEATRTHRPRRARRGGAPAP